MRVFSCLFFPLEKTPLFHCWYVSLPIDTKSPAQGRTGGTEGKKKTGALLCLSFVLCGYAIGAGSLYLLMV